MAAEKTCIFYKCECGIFFATEEAKATHQCPIKEPDVSPVECDSKSLTLFKCSECEGLFSTMQVFQGHTCVGGAKSDTPVQESKGDEHKQCSMLWDRSSTLLLISFYKTYMKAVETGKLKKNSMFAKIAQDLKEEGYIYTNEQVTGRWKTLLRAYKSVKDNNKKSGASRKTYEYEDALDDILENDPSINPTFTLSSDSVSPSGSSSTSCSLDAEEEDEQPVKKKRRRNSSNEMVEVFKNFIADQKEEQRKRDELQEQKIGLMKSLVDVLKGMKDK